MVAGLADRRAQQVPPPPQPARQQRTHGRAPRLRLPPAQTRTHQLPKQENNDSPQHAVSHTFSEKREPRPGAPCKQTSWDFATRAPAHHHRRGALAHADGSSLCLHCGWHRHRGLRLGRSEARRRYDRLAAIDPHHLPGQWQFLQQLCPKSGGEWPHAHTFARETAAAAPPGSFDPVLVAEAHLEHWLEEHGRSAAAGRRYLSAGPVRDELNEAADRSVRHPAFRRTHGWVRVTSTFAMAFALLDDRPAAAALFTALGDLGSDRPWDYLGDPGPTIVKYRKRAGGGGT